MKLNPQIAVRDSNRATTSVRATFVIIAGFLSSSCQAGGARTSDVAVTDSSGIEIVVNPTSQVERTWRSLSAEPLLEIGEVDGDDAYLFNGVEVGLRHDDGRIVVLDWSTMHLKYFDSTGRHLRSAAGRGSGPGEFQTVGYSAAADTDSTIAFVDMAQVLHFDWNGQYLGRTAVDYNAILNLTPPDFHSSLPVFPTDEGYWLQWSSLNEWRELTATLRERDRAFFLYSPGFKAIDTLATGLAETTTRIGTAWPFVPFRPGPQAAVGGRPGRIYVTLNESFEIRQFDGTGRLQRMIRAPVGLELLSDADVADWQESERARGERRGDPQNAELRIREMPTPDALAPFKTLFVDRLGRLWAERYDHVGEPRRYLVVDTTGIVLGNVAIPCNLTLLDVGEEYVLAKWRNELDVEFVRLYSY